MSADDQAASPSATPQPPEPAQAPGPSTPAARSQQEQSDASSSGRSGGPERDYQALYEQIKGQPCRVVQLDKVYEGKDRAMRTKSYIIDRELQRVHDATTLEEIHVALEEAGRNLQQLGIFERVDMLVSEEPEVGGRLGASQACN